MSADAAVQAPRRVGMRCGAQRRMKIGGCANWRPKDTRLPWRPQLEREDFRGSLGAARMSACATWRRASFLAGLSVAQEKSSPEKSGLAGPPAARGEISLRITVSSGDHRAR